ncbi:MAG: hypothetical protein ACKESC_00455 [Candidatus Hodgkinia cicadicola]
MSITVVISGVIELNVVAYDLNGLESDDIRSKITDVMAIICDKDFIGGNE